MTEMCVIQYLTKAQLQTFRASPERAARKVFLRRKGERGQATACVSASRWLASAAELEGEWEPIPVGFQPPEWLGLAG